MLALAWASYQVPTIKRDGWVRAVPTTALVLWPMSTRGWLDRAAFKTGSPPSSLDAELERRVANLELHRWQELILEYRFAVASGIDKRGALCAYECTDLGRVCWAPLRNNGCFREPVGPEWIQGVCDVDASALEWLVTGTVDTESWAINGGDGGALRVLCGKLVVQTSAASHQQIQVLLNGLRAAMASRGNPTAVLPPNVQRLSHDFAPDNHVVQDNR